MKTRNLSPADYFEVLQREYLIAEFRSKIYFSPKDKTFYKRLMNYKRGKINDIAQRNNLKSIFTDAELKKSISAEVFENGVIRGGMSVEDMIMYYKEGNKFSFQGNIYELADGCISEDFVYLKSKRGENSLPIVFKADKKDILRIL